MIQTSTFNIMLAVGFAMILYSVIDHRNRIYANIALSFISGIIFAYLANAISLGVVESGASASFGDIMKLISLFAFGYTLFMGYEVVDEEFQKKEILSRHKEDEE